MSGILGAIHARDVLLKDENIIPFDDEAKCLLSNNLEELLFALSKGN